MARKRKKQKKSIEDELNQILTDIDNIHLCESILDNIEYEDSF